MKSKHYSDRLLPPLVSRAGVTVLLVFIVVPVLYLIDLALSPNTTVALGGTGLGHLSLHNFSDMWTSAPIGRGLLNSVIIAGISAVLAVILGVAAAYPLARLVFRARKPLLYSMLGSQSIPGLALLLLAGLQAIPRDQLEAATVDGAGWWARLRYIVIPQLKGIYALAFALSTLYHFGNFTLPYIMFGNTRPSSTVTLPINIYYIAFQGFDFGIASATAVFNVVILAVPAVIYLWIVRFRPARARAREVVA